MAKKALSLIANTLIEGGSIKQEVEEGAEGKILIVDLYNKERENVGTVRLYQSNDLKIVSVLIS